MSAPRSEFAKMLKRSDQMSKQYAEQIARQRRIIDRLVAANAVQSDVLYAVGNEASNIRDARKWAKEATAKVKELLAVPKEEEK